MVMIAPPTARGPYYPSVQQFGFRCMLLSLATGFVVIVEPAPTDIFFSLGLLALLMAVGVRVQAPRDLTVFYLGFIAFTAFNLLSMPYSFSLPFAVRYFLITLYLLLVPVGMVHFAVVYGRRAVDQMYIAFFVGATISASLGASVLLGVAPGSAELWFREGDGLRLSPLFKDPNVYGPYMAAAGLVLLGWLLAGRAGRRLWPFLLVPFILTMMLLTFSRGAWANTALALAIFTPLLLINARSWKRLSWLILGVAIGGVLLLTGGSLVLEALGLSEFFEARFGLQEYDSYRFENWGSALQLTLSEPIGIGPGQYVGRTSFPDSQVELATHNVYLKVAAENGWLGFVAYFGAIASVLWGLARRAFIADGRAPLRIMLIAVLLGQLGNSIVVDSLHWRHLFVLLGFACAEIYLAGRGQTDRPAPGAVR